MRNPKQKSLLDFAEPEEKPIPTVTAPEVNGLHSPVASSASETFVEKIRPTDQTFSSGEKAKARDIISAIRTLQSLEHERRPPSDAERQILAKYPGFGCVALHIFPDPVTKRYKRGWLEVGTELHSLLTPAEYESAKRTTFNAFYTSSTVIKAMYEGLKRLGVPEDGLTLEPGCGPGRFLYLAPKDMRFIGVELDSISGRIAKALHPKADIRIENFQDTKLPPLDAVIGNVPFADIPFQHGSQKFSLHDGFVAKSVDALKPGGVLALITSHFTLDKVNAGIREYLSERADLIGAIRLPSDAFKREGTSVVTDIVFLRKRSLDEPPSNTEWLTSSPLEIDGARVSVNKYFLSHPEMVLGEWSRKNLQYGREGYSIKSNGDLAEQLREAVGRLPGRTAVSKNRDNTATENGTSTGYKGNDSTAALPFVPPPPERHVTEGSFFVHDKRIHQIVDGKSEPVVYGGGELWANGGLVGRRMGALIDLRDKARYVLRSQNEGWPAEARESARRKLNYTYDAFKSAYGPINKTTISDGEPPVRRMPNLVKFREDPDAMLVMALEEYDEETGTAKKAPIMSRDVVGRTPPITSVTSAEEGLLVSLDHKGAVDLSYISKLYGKPEDTIITELGDLIYQDPESKTWVTADEYLSGNVRAKLAAAEKAGATHNIEALRAVQPEDVLPGDIDANLGAPWIPASDIQAFAADLFQVMPNDISIGHLAKDAVWSVEGNYSRASAHFE